MEKRYSFRANKEVVIIAALLVLSWLFMDDLSNSTCSTEGAIIPAVQLGGGYVPVD